jgi:hypothetical protein
MTHAWRHHPMYDDGGTKREYWATSIGELPLTVAKRGVWWVGWIGEGREPTTEPTRSRREAQRRVAKRAVAHFRKLAERAKRMVR